MFHFNLIAHSEKLSDFTPEEILLKELSDSVDFYDDCPPSDLYSRFSLAVEILCYEACRTHCLNLEINGFGIEWKEYFRYLDNILPDILFTLSDIKNSRPTNLYFYSAGRKIVFTPLNKQLYQIQIDSHAPHPITETASTDYLQTALEQIAAAFFQFAKTVYPLIFSQYLLPYLKEKSEREHLIHF